MSQLNSHRLIAVLVIVFIGWGQADARPKRVDQIPNGSMFSCASCHVTRGGPRTLFGQEIERNYLTQSGGSGDVVWNAMLAMLDSDGDGVSNGQELGDPDGDGMTDASIQVTNPGDPNSFVQQQPVMPALTSFVIGGVTLQKDVKNPPVPSGMQQFEITFNVPLEGVTPNPAGGINIENVGVVTSFPIGLFAIAPDTSDPMKLKGSVNLPEGATYQVLIGISDFESIPNISELQQYFLGTVELSDAVVSGVGLLPEGVTLSDTPGIVALINPDLLPENDEGTFEVAIVRVSNLNVLESMPEQLAFEFPYVPDGTYALSMSQGVVNAEGNIDTLSAFVGLNMITGGVDPAALIQVVDGASVTDLQIVLQTEPELVDIREVSVQSVNAETNSFSIGQQVNVDVSQALMITLDQRNLEDIIAIFFSGNVEDLAQLIFPISDLMAGDTVSILGFPLTETAIQALIVIRQAPSQTPSADLDSDGDVDFSDFLLFVAAFGTSEGGPGYNAAADLDGDGTVAFSDFLIFANAFGKPVGGN